MSKGTEVFCAQRVEKVNLQISTRWQTSRNGTEFRFLAKEDVPRQNILRIEQNRIL